MKNIVEEELRLDLGDASPPPASGGGSKTKGTSGRRGRASSASADLTSSLASRWRRETDLDGSPLYTLRWSVKTTPAGRSVPTLLASARRTTKDGNSTLLPPAHWPTPVARDWKGPQGRAYKGQSADLPTVALWLRRDGEAPTTASSGGWPSAKLTMKGGLRLNPSHVRWLMGIPASWDSIAATATRIWSETKTFRKEGTTMTNIIGTTAANAALITEINKAVKAANDAEQSLTIAKQEVTSRSKAVGLLLLEAKKLHPKVADFEAFLKRVNGLGRSRAYDLMRMADGRTTDEGIKKAVRDRVRKHRKKLQEKVSVTSQDVTELPEASAERRKAENADLDLTADEIAAARSAKNLAEFEYACSDHLPKLTGSDLERARAFFLEGRWKPTTKVRGEACAWTRSLELQIPNGELA